MPKRPTDQETAISIVSDADLTLIIEASKGRLSKEGAGRQFERFSRSGITGRRLRQALALVPRFQTNATSLIRWLDDGLTLGRIERCLKLQRETGFCTGDSVLVINWFLDDLNSPDDPEASDQMEAEFLAFFRDTFVEITGRFSAQRLKFFIDAHCPNGVHEAYNWAMIDPEGFVKTVNSSSSWRSSSGRPMPDLAEIYDLEEDQDSLGELYQSRED